MSRRETLRPLVTSEKRCTPLSSLRRTARSISSRGMMSYSAMPVAKWRDWAHHAQSSVHRPDRALAMEQVSMRLPCRAMRTRSAASQSSSVA